MSGYPLFRKPVKGEGVCRRKIQLTTKKDSHYGVGRKVGVVKKRISLIVKTDNGTDHSWELTGLRKGKVDTKKTPFYPL